MEKERDALQVSDDGSAPRGADWGSLRAGWRNESIFPTAVSVYRRSPGAGLEGEGEVGGERDPQWPGRPAGSSRGQPALFRRKKNRYLASLLPTSLPPPRLPKPTLNS